MHSLLSTTRTHVSAIQSAPSPGSGDHGPPIAASGDCTDLRRRRRRELVQRLVDRSAWLAPADRLLIESIYRDHRRVADIARLGEIDPRALRRRVRRLVRRVLSPRFAFVVARVIEVKQPRATRHAADASGSADHDRGSAPAPGREAGAWSSTRRRIAAECYLNGRSIRDVAHMLNLSMHAVRRHRDAVEALFQAARG